MINRQMNEVEVECLPGDLPEAIEVDLVNLGVGDSLHLSDLVLPTGVVLVALTHGEGQDQAVVGVLMPRGEKTEEGSEEGAPGESAES
jgi:large subunit ribosomal protein L25